jgi:histidine triad (HIT) family protein
MGTATLRIGRNDDECVFCRIALLDPLGQVMRRYAGAVVFAPISPVTPGHLLVVSDEHVRDASERPAVTVVTFEAAAREAQRAGPCNLITSCGAEATQTVMHLHIHVVPRRHGDGLRLPWTAPEHDL